MSASVENKIVAMKFDNKQFEEPAKRTMGTLERLKASLNFSKSSRNLNELQNTANRFSLSGLGNAATGIGAQFTAMSAVALTAIATITTKAVNAGYQISKGLAIDPIRMGLNEYEQNLNAVQTIMSGTGETVGQVNKTLAELNHYSDQTIYSFSDMTENIKHFTNAGLSSKKAANVMMGISNAAAAAGSGAEAAGRAMYGFGQSMSMGFIGLQDWNQIDTAGVATKEFKEELIKAGLAAGTLEKSQDGTIRTNKGTEVSFKNLRTTLQDQWATSEVLVSTLNKYSDTSTKVGKKADDNAKRVKTLSQLMGVLKESAQSGWSETFLHLFGDLEEASKLWTTVNDVVGGFISNSAKVRNELLKTWKDDGGRQALLDGLVNIFKVLVEIVKPITKAFREMFPPITGKQLVDITKNFREFTEDLKIGDGTIDKIRRTAKGLFAAFSIGVSIIKGVLGVIGKLFGYLSSQSGGFLETTASVGDFLVKLDETITKGDLVTKFFEDLGNAIMNPRDTLKQLGDSISDFFSNLGDNPFEGLSEYLGRFKDRLGPLLGVVDKISAAWGGLVNVFKKIGKVLAPAIEVIGNAFSGIGEAITKGFKEANFDGIQDALNTGLLAGITLLINKFLNNGLNVDFGGGIVEEIKGTFGALTDTLKSMQNQIQSKTILAIAGAVALLTLSIAMLSTIDSKNLTKSLSALTVAFGQLLAAMAILGKISGTAGFAKIPAIAATMILLATSILILSAAVKVLSTLSWEELAKGLSGVAALLGMLIVASSLLGKSSGGMLRAGLAMIPLAIGIKILASAVKDFAEMSWGEMAKGLTALAGSLLVIAGAMKLMPKSMVLQAAGLLILSIALNGIALALNNMGGMSWGEIVKGLVALAGALAIIAGGLYLMTAALPGAAALIVAAGALSILTPVLLLLGTMSVGDIVKGLVTIAGALLILAGGLTLMAGTIGGAGALLAASIALSILAPVLVVLGNLSWGAIIKGLVAIAGAFVVLGLAGLVLTPLIPSILGLAGALFLIGTGMALVGVGAAGLASAFAVFAAQGSAALSTLVGFIALIPQFLVKFAEGVVAFVVSIASQTGKLVTSFASLFGAVLDAVIMLLPKIGTLITTLVQTIIRILLDNAPALAGAGLTLILMLLNAISNKIGLIVTIAASIIVKFLNAIANSIPRVARAGANLIIKFMDAIATEIPRLADAGAKAVIKFLNGTADAIRNNKDAMVSAGKNLGSAILEGMVAGIRGGMEWVAGWAWSAARGAYEAAKRALGINSPSKEFAKLGRWSDEGLAKGLKDNAGMVEKAGENVADSAINSVNNALSDMYTMMSGDINVDPVITPVLDLSNITRDASKLGGMLDQTPIEANLSYRSASDISNAEQDRADASNNIDAELAGSTIVELTQNNYSPKALSPADIYRNTKSQLALVKEAVARP